MARWIGNRLAEDEEPIRETGGTPNPGSGAAVAAGCICPVLDNHHGAGYRGQEGLFAIVESRPVHALRLLTDEELSP